MSRSSRIQCSKILSFEISIQYYFSFYFCLFSFCCFSLCSCVVSAVIGCSNGYFFAFLAYFLIPCIDESTQSSMSWDCVDVHSFDEISSTELPFKKFSCSSQVPLSNFSIHLCLFCRFRFRYCQVLVVFLPLKGLDVFLIRQFHSFRTLFNTTFHSYTLTVCSYCLVSSSFTFLTKYLDFINIHKVVYLF